VLYRRTVAGGAGAGGAVVAGDGTAGSFPAETDGARAKPRVTGGLYGFQNEV
jgi:hypothetical protein